MSKEMFYKLCQKVWDEPYTSLYIDTNANAKDIWKYRKNLNTPISIDN